MSRTDRSRRVTVALVQEGRWSRRRWSRRHAHTHKHKHINEHIGNRIVLHASCVLSATESMTLKIGSVLGSHVVGTENSFGRSGSNFLSLDLSA